MNYYDEDKENTFIFIYTIKLYFFSFFQKNGEKN